MIAEEADYGAGVYGLFPANAVGDDVELYADESRGTVLERFHFLRQQANREGPASPVPVAGGFYCAEGDGTARSHGRVCGDERDWA
jgi:cobalamin-dependent methionine synthase I